MAPPDPPASSRMRALGPGLLFAGAAVGVSHIVQSTQAGAREGLALGVIILAANFFKYPAFAFGPRYAVATGTSLLEGYRRQGKWALALYALLTFGTMFTVQAAVTLVAAALILVATGPLGIGDLSPNGAGSLDLTVVSAGLIGVCAALLAVGKYPWLEGATKFIMAVLTVTTVVAAMLAVPRIDFAAERLLPASSSFTDAGEVVFIAALIGWMPSAIDISVWHSLWTLEKVKKSGALTARDSRFDFDLGYIGTALLAMCFMLVGAGFMHHSGQPIADKPVGFANQVVSMFTASLGDWARPLILVCAITVMFSTVLTVVDGFPRALSILLQRWKSAEVPGETNASGRRAYWNAAALIGVVSLGIIAYATAGKAAGTLQQLVNLATTLSFLSAPMLCWLNHRVMTSPEIRGEAVLSRRMRLFSVAGIVFSSLFAVWYLWVTFVA